MRCTWPISIRQSSAMEIVPETVSRLISVSLVLATVSQSMPNSEFGSHRMNGPRTLKLVLMALGSSPRVMSHVPPLSLLTVTTSPVSAMVAWNGASGQGVSSATLKLVSESVASAVTSPCGRRLLYGATSPENVCQSIHSDDGGCGSQCAAGTKGTWLTAGMKSF